MGAGGAVCFASGFAEVEDGADLNTALLLAAGEMPILGPNCYGMINNCDGALLWPDQHGCLPVARGVAILTQSSNIAINLTMQSRALPISYVITCGNQAQTTQAEIALGLLEDQRVTAIGLHIEGFGDIAAWQTLARVAKAKNIALIALKVGKSTQAQSATISHTASLAGSDAGAAALLDRLGIARVDDLATLPRNPQDPAHSRPAPQRQHRHDQLLRRRGLAGRRPLPTSFRSPSLRSPKHSITRLYASPRPQGRARQPPRLPHLHLARCRGHDVPPFPP